VAAAERHAVLKRERANQTLLLHLVLLGAALAIGLAGFVIVLRRVAGPISAMTDVMQRLAGGAYSVRIPGSQRRDELGAMAHAAEVFKENAIERQRLTAERLALTEQAAEKRKAEMLEFAHQFETAIGHIVNAVSSSANELEAAAGTLSDTTQSTQRLAKKAAGASEQASKNVVSVSSTTEEMTTAAHEITVHAQHATSIAREAVAQAQKTDARISELAEVADQIGAVLKLINDIAQQTNLLALNATIEAARAGEAGRGFAVVAGEVKALAGQTAKATEEIGSQIHAKQQATGRAVAGISAIERDLREIGEVSR